MEVVASVKKLLKTFDWLEEAFIVVLMTFMVTLNFINVVSRRVFSASLSFTEELTIIAFVWITMIGIAAAYKRLAHLGMSFIVDKFGPKGKAVFSLLSMVCSLVLIVVMIIYGIDMIQGQIAMNAKTPALMLPAWIQGASIPVGGAFMAFRTIQAYLSDFARLRKMDKEEGGIA